MLQRLKDLIDQIVIKLKTIPTKVSELENDEEFAKESDLSLVAFTGKYNDLTGLPASSDVWGDYANISGLLLDQSNQGNQYIYLVEDASDDSNITFDPAETKLQAFYKYNGVATGSIDDYTLISAPYANQSADFQGVETVNTPDIELSGDGTGGNPIEAELTNTVKNDIQKGVTAQGWGNHADAGYEKESNKATDLSNPDNTKYPTTKAVTDAIGAIEATVHTNNTPDIELSGDGTQGTPLEAELTQIIKDDIDKGVTAHSYDLDDVAKNGNETEEEIEVGGLSIRRTDISTKRFSKPLTTIGTGKYIVIKTDRKIDDPNNPLVIEMNGGGYKEESGVYVKISFRTSLSTVIVEPNVPKILTNNTDLTEAYIIEVDGYLCVAFNRIQGAALGSYVSGFHYFETIGCNIISVTSSDDLDNILSTLGINYLATHDWVNEQIDLNKNWSNNRFLRYDTDSQNLTPTEQENARANLGLNIIPSVIALMHGEAEEDIYPVLPNLQWDITIQSIVLVSRDTVTGSDLEARILVDDTPQQGADLIIPANSRASNEVNLIDWDAGQNIDLEVTQTGSTDAGSNLALYIYYSLRS